MFPANVRQTEAAGRQAAGADRNYPCQERQTITDGNNLAKKQHGCKQAKMPLTQIDVDAESPRWSKQADAKS